MTFDENFPKRLSSARNVAGLTQSNLASMAETVVRQIAAYEAGDARPRAKTLKKIAAALGTTEEWLCRGVGSSPTTETFSRIRNIKQVPILVDGVIDEFIHADHIEPGAKMHPCDMDLSNKAFAFKVRGDSMTSSMGMDDISIPNGSIVTVDPLHEFSNGGFALISQNNDLIRVKKIVIENGYANIISLNRVDYPAEICKLSDIDYIYPIVKVEIYIDTKPKSKFAWDEDFLPPTKIADSAISGGIIIYPAKGEPVPSMKELTELYKSLDSKIDLLMKEIKK